MEEEKAAAAPTETEESVETAIVGATRGQRAEDWDWAAVVDLE